MTLRLRGYQSDLIEQARGYIREGANSILIQAPTGSGKTVLVAKMLKNAAERGYRAWFCVHRRELIAQSVVTLSQSAGIEAGIVAAGFPQDRSMPIQVCSIATLRHRRKQLRAPSLVIFDEAHHLAAKSWADIFAAYPGAVHIGLTATPERLDGTGLGKWFKHLIVGPSVSQLIEQGYLSNYRLFAPPPPDLAGVHVIAGDYNKRELSAAMSRSTVTGDVITHYRKYAPGKRMVLFAWSIEASKELAARFNTAGIQAEHVDGDTDNATRDLAMARFRDGKTLVLTNVDLFGEGVDVPAIEAVALLRPTQSLTLYLQQVGRGLRPAIGKERAIILDHAGNCRRFGMPDDARHWTLDGRRDGKIANDAAPIKQCPMCYAVMTVSVDVCKHCGYKFQVVSREINEVDGELEEVKILAREERMRQQNEARTLDDLIKIGKLRKYKRPKQWAEHVFNARLAKKAAQEALAHLRGEHANADE